MSALLAGAIILLDQATKFLVGKFFSLGESLEVIPGCFDLRYAHNTGAAWGIFSGKANGLAIFSIAMLVLMVVFRRKIFAPVPAGRVIFGLLCGGIVGNLADRLFRGHVVDFLDFHWGPHHFPTFNVADSALCIGTALFLIVTFVADHRAKLQAAEGAKPPDAGE